MNDVPIPPSLDMWIFAGAGLGALLTWMIMHLAGRNSYRHGLEHGRLEADSDLQDRLDASEHERARLQAALEQAAAQMRRLGEATASSPQAQAGGRPETMR